MAEAELRTTQYRTGMYIIVIGKSFERQCRTASDWLNQLKCKPRLSSNNVQIDQCYFSGSS